MAVTLIESDLMQPNGELSPHYFPDNDLEAQLPGWLAKASIKVEASTINSDSHDQAAESWVYYLAYTHIARRLAAMPSSTSVNQGADAVSYAADRPAYWADLAADKKAEYIGLIPVVEGTVKTPRASFAIPTRAVW